MTEDAELTNALSRVTAHLPAAPLARLVHDPAVRGAEVGSREKTAENEAIERLVAFSTRQVDGLDRSVLEHIDDLAWLE